MQKSTALSYTIALILSLYSVICLALMIGVQFDSQDYSIYLIRGSAIITLTATGIFTTLCGILIYTGLMDHFNSQKLSPLFGPVLMKAVSLVGVFTITSVSALDRLIHGTNKWKWIADPEVRLIILIFYTGVIAGFAWFLEVILRGRGWTETNIFYTYIGITTISILTVFFIALGVIK